MQRGEIRNCSDGGPSAADDLFGLTLAAVAGDRRKTGESSDLPAICRADLRQLSHEGGSNDHADTRHRLNHQVRLGQFGRRPDGLGDPDLSLFDAPLQKQDLALDVGSGIDGAE